MPIVLLLAACTGGTLAPAETPRLQPDRATATVTANTAACTSHLSAVDDANLLAKLNAIVDYGDVMGLIRWPVANFGSRPEQPGERVTFDTRMGLQQVVYLRSRTGETAPNSTFAAVRFKDALGYPVLVILVRHPTQEAALCHVRGVTRGASQGSIGGLSNWDGHPCLEGQFCNEFGEIRGDFVTGQYSVFVALDVSFWSQSMAYGMVENLERLIDQRLKSAADPSLGANGRVADGIFRVGKDIPIGRYQTVGGGSCSWSVANGTFSTGELGFRVKGQSGPATIDILPKDTWFFSNSCGSWQPVQ